MIAKKPLLCKVLIRLTKKWGRGLFFFAAQGTDRTWQMKSGLKSPHYTPNWDELPKAS